MAIQQRPVQPLTRMSDEQYKYDVFISYRWVEPDKKWVRTQLKPALENAGLNVLLDQDDFVPGRNPLSEITRATTQSRRGLCVITPDYVKNPRRMAYVESLALSNYDPLGATSRLIPFIIRKAKLPPHLDLVAVDWTDPAYRQREWTRLLKLLGAKIPNAPLPGPVPPPPWIRIPSIVWMVLPALVLVALGGIGYKAWTRPKTVMIAGHIYYKESAEDTGHIPVEGVVVFLSTMPDLQSNATGPDGSFTLRSVPASAFIDLTARYGTQDFKMGYSQDGNYYVIPRDNQLIRQFITSQWIEDTKEDCLPDNNAEPALFKVYKNNIQFPAEAGNRNVTLRIELLDSPFTTIQSANIRFTPKDSYRNDSPPGEDRSKSHTWLFDLSKSGLKTQVIVCLGSDDRNTVVTSANLRTYFQ